MASAVEAPDLDAEAFLASAAAHASAVGVRTHAGTRFILDTADRGVGLSLIGGSGRQENAVLSRVLRVLEENGGLKRRRTFLDLGANIGTTTIAALAGGGFRTAIAAEPVVRNYRLLRANLALNGLLDRVRTLCVAVSDSDGSATMALSARNSGAHYVAEGVSEAKLTKLARMGQITEVPARSVSSLVRCGQLDPDEVDLVWVDTQGHEGHVLAGAGALLRRSVPVLLEFHPELLERSGGLELFFAAAREHYTHVVDVRRVQARLPADLLPVERLSEIASRLQDEGLPGRFTDVLLLRGSRS